MTDAVRLTEHFFFFDPDHGTHVSRSFAKGVVVTDQEAIAFLLEHNASIEPIDTDINSSHKTRS